MEPARVRHRERGSSAASQRSRGFTNTLEDGCDATEHKLHRGPLDLRPPRGKLHFAVDFPEASKLREELTAWRSDGLVGRRLCFARNKYRLANGTSLGLGTESEPQGIFHAINEELEIRNLIVNRRAKLISRPTHESPVKRETSGVMLFHSFRPTHSDRFKQSKVNFNNFAGAGKMLVPEIVGCVKNKIALTQTRVICWKFGVFIAHDLLF